jgi:hypothetical protein
MEEIKEINSTQNPNQGIIQMITGGILSFVGLAVGFWVYTRFTDSGFVQHTWSSPFSTYEVNTFIGLAIAIMFLLVGCVLLIIGDNMYNWRKGTITVPFQNRENFLSKLNVAVNKMRYLPQSQTETCLIFTRLRGKLSVQIEQNSARIVGPLMDLRRLQKKLTQVSI